MIYFLLGVLNEFECDFTILLWLMLGFNGLDTLITFFISFTGYYLIAYILIFYTFFSTTNALFISHGWSASSSIVIRFLGLSYRHLWITSKHESESDFYIYDFIRYFPYLIS
jgi:hypothetical protein